MSLPALARGQRFTAASLLAHCFLQQEIPTRFIYSTDDIYSRPDSDPCLFGHVGAVCD